MTISLDRLLGHMAWANQKTIEHLQSLPEASLKAFGTNREWFVGEIVHHIVDSADHYAFRISGKPALTQPGDPCIEDVNVTADLARLKEQAAKVDAMLMECLKLDDEQIEFVNDAYAREPLPLPPRVAICADLPACISFASPVSEKAS